MSIHMLVNVHSFILNRPSSSLSYESWIYNYMYM